MKVPTHELTKTYTSLAEKRKKLRKRLGKAKATVENSTAKGSPILSTSTKVYLKKCVNLQMVFYSKALPKFWKYVLDITNIPPENFFIFPENIRKTLLFWSSQRVEEIG